MVDIRSKYGMKRTKKADFLHSSGYAKEQSGDNIGSAGKQVSFATRSAMEEQRKYVRKYRNAKLLQGVRGFERAKTYVPRVEKVAGVSPGRGSLTDTPSTGAAMGARSQKPLGPSISSTPSRRLPGIKL